MLGRVSNTTLWILPVSGVPPPLQNLFGKKGVTDLGGTPLPPFTDFSPKKILQQGLKIVFFAQKTPDFGPKNMLRIWGVPFSPPVRIFFQQKGVYGFGGFPPPPFTDKIRKVVFDGLPYHSEFFGNALREK